MTPLETIRPAKLWKALPDEQKLAAATAFWTDEHAAAEQAEVIGALARQINFRPRSVLALPVERRARLLAKMTTVSDPVAARLLVVYHLGHQRPMMKAFLDALGLAHEDGLIDDDAKAPDRERMTTAARGLFEGHDAADVELYFRTLLLQDPDTWGPLEEVLAERATR